MHVKFIIFSSTLIGHVLLAKYVKTCMKTDLLYTHHIKELQLYCSRYENIDHRIPQETKIKEILAKKFNMATNSNGFYRPRSALARALYEKHNNDRYLQEFDQNQVC